MPNRQDGAERDAAKKMVARVDHPNPQWFRLPQVLDRQRGGRKTESDTGAQFYSMAEIGDAGPSDEPGHNGRSHQIANKVADHFRGHAALLEFHAVLLNCGRPGFAEQGHVPNGANDPVSCRGADYWYPVHARRSLNRRPRRQEKIRPR